VNALRRLLVVTLILIAAAVAALFAFNNPQRMDVDIGVARLESVPASVAFATAFALGWAFGLGSAGFALLRISAEKRRLRRELRLTEAQARSLRDLPLSDAD
jgi:uncharacterized membrane protein YciS (DUF1049 family)